MFIAIRKTVCKCQRRTPVAELICGSFCCGQCDNQPWGVVPDYLGLFNNARLEIMPGAGHVIATERLKE